MNPPASDDHGDARKRKQATVIAAALASLVVVIVAAVVGVVFGQKAAERNDKSGLGRMQEETQSPSTVRVGLSEAPSTAPLLRPTVQGAIDCTGRESNNRCECAFPIQQENFRQSISGSILNATLDSVPTCDRISQNGVGVWYRLDGDNQRLTASTCDSSFADTQISVFVGSCQKLQCVVGNDQMSTCGNGSQSQVGFFAKSGVVYYIYVHGYKRSRFNFQLQVVPLVDNDSCSQAIDWVEPVFGSTAGAIPLGNSVVGILSPDTRGVWYRYVQPGTVDTGALVLRRVEVNVETTGFRGSRIAIFKGDSCDSLEPEPSSSSRLLAVPGSTYYFFVHGQYPTDQGDFVLSVGPLLVEVRAAPVPITCADAVPLILGDYVDEPFLDYTADFTLTTGTCGDGVRFSEAYLTGSGFFGSWYSILGTGKIFAASICFANSTNTNGQLQISVFGGVCGSLSSEFLECIDGIVLSNGGCLESDAVYWQTESDTPYYIFVQPLPREPGRLQQRPQYSLLVDEISSVPSQDCQGATELSIYDPRLIDSSGLLAFSLPGIVSSRDERVSWYSFAGNGMPLSISTCGPGSARGSRIIVFRGGCQSTMEAILPVRVSSCGPHQSVKIDSETGEIYHAAVLVSPFLNQTATHSIALRQSPVNDECSLAIGCLLPDPTKSITGSSASASISGISVCHMADDSVARDVFFTLLGTGLDFHILIDDVFTAFSLRVQVMTGGCEDLVCVTSSDDGYLSWSTEADEVYLIRIAGTNNLDFGSFSYTICEGSIECVDRYRDI